MDKPSYQTGFEDALDCVLEIMRLQNEDAFGRVSEIATRVRLGKADEILEALRCP